MDLDRKAALLACVSEPPGKAVVGVRIACARSRTNPRDRPRSIA
jgi:hypothetical protein